MDTAAFQLENYKFTKVSLDVDQAAKNSNISFGVSGLFDSSEQVPKYDLTFNVDVINNDTGEAFFSIECHGLFLFENEITIETIPDFFYMNAIAILFPYVRAYLSLVTSQANIRPLILPTLNLSTLSPTLKENTRLKN